MSGAMGLAVGADLQGALNAHDSAPQHESSRATVENGRAHQLPLAIFGVFFDTGTGVHNAFLRGHSEGEVLKAVVLGGQGCGYRHNWRGTTLFSHLSHSPDITANVYSMSTDPRVALQSLVSAFEEHLIAVSNRRSDSDPAVEGAYVAIADAFDAYEEALYDAYDEVTPLTVFAEDDDDDFDDDGDEDLIEDNEMLDEDLVDEDDFDDEDDSPESGSTR